MRTHNVFFLLAASATALLACDSNVEGGSGGSTAEGGGTTTGVTSSTSGAPQTNSSVTTSNGTTTSGSTSSTGGDGGGGSGGGDNIVWSNVTITDGCFLFSEPGLLGNVATWDDDGTEITLTFDSVGRSYAGPSGDRMPVLEAIHEETFAGEVWQYREVFTGTHVGETFQGSWSYTECNFTVEPENCPANGGCEGKADFVITTGSNGPE